MITLFVFVIVLAATLTALASRRHVLFLIIVIAALQDPLRKVMVGAPGWMTLLPVPVFYAAVLSSLAGNSQWWKKFRRMFSSVGKLIYLLVLLVIPAALISLTFGPGSWQYTILGIISYSLIFFAIIQGFHYAPDIEAVRTILGFYAAVHGVMLSGAVPQYLGWFPDWLVIGDKALGHEWIRWIPGYIIRMISGFYRSADIMGWHAATVCMLGMILAFSEKGRARWFWIGVSAWAILALFLSGRRKMVYMIPIFLLTISWVYVYIGRAARIIPMVGFVVIPALSVYLVGDFLGEDSGQIQYYTSGQAGDTVFERVERQGFGTLAETYRQAGFFGNGLGFATPGSHHLEGARPRIWQESGTSRVLVELGVPGFLGFIALIVGIVFALWKVARAHLRARTPAGVYAAGLLSFFVANLGSLTVSGQILADSFVVIFMGMLVGITLGFARKEFMPTEMFVGIARVANGTGHPALTARASI